MERFAIMMEKNGECCYYYVLTDVENIDEMLIDLLGAEQMEQLYAYPIDNAPANILASFLEAVKYGSTTYYHKLGYFSDSMWQAYLAQHVAYPWNEMEKAIV